MKEIQHTDLSFITNEKDKDLYKRFTTLIKTTRFFDVLVGYFYLSGFHLMYKSLEKTEKIRILIGIDTDQATKELFYAGKEHMENELIKRLKKDMDASEDSMEVEKGVRTFLRWLQIGKLEIRAYKERNIHAKLYIMTFDEDDRDKGRVITGSSNFTEAGLKHNIEFNVELKDRNDYEFARKKFEELWEDSDTFDMAETYSSYIPNNTWVKEGISPHQLYLKFLYEYFKEELDEENILEDEYLPEGFKEYEYQKEAAINATRILKEYGGVFIADVVGLGKTFTVSLLLKQNNVRGRVLVIAPPTLVDEKNPASWKNVLSDFAIAAKCVSYGKIKSAVKQSAKYDYIVIDEAHRVRNDDTQTYEKVAELCKDRKVILVSATPLNNRPKDILNLIKLFQRPRKSSIPSLPNLERFFTDLEKKLKKLDRGKDYDRYIRITKENAAEIRARVLKYITVRRTRKEIETYYKEDMKKEHLNFPVINDPMPIFYELNEQESKVFEDTIKIIAQKIKYARYTPTSYLIDPSDTFLPETSQRNLVSFMKTMLIKRLESSFHAFRRSLDRFISYNQHFLKGMEKGYVYFSKKKSEVLFAAIDNDDEETINKLLISGDVKDSPVELFSNHLKRDVESDLETLMKLRSMWEGISRDPKMEKLKALLKDSSKLKKKVIIFTESKETSDYIVGELKKGYKDQILQFTGASEKAVRQKVIDNFDANVKAPQNEYRVLVSTEVLSEGVNMHRSNTIINYDIPWNPTRLMQRAGRVNRIDTKFKDINIFNFFPSDEGNDEIKLEEAAKIKIALFIDSLGADAQTLTEGEVIQSHELFNKLISSATITGEENQLQSELKYLHIIKEIRDENGDLYKEIQKLPKKARTARYYEGKKNQLLTYFRKNKNIQKFFIVSGKKSKEVDFMEAAALLEASKKDKAVDVLDDFYEKLDSNKNSFREETNIYSRENAGGTARRGRSNENELNRILKFLRKHTKDFNNAQYIMDVLKVLQDGALPRTVVRRTIKATKPTLNEIEKGNGGDENVWVSRIKSSIPERFVATAQAPIEEYEREEEVILSEYLISK